MVLRHVPNVETIDGYTVTSAMRAEAEVTNPPWGSLIEFDAKWALSTILNKFQQRNNNIPSIQID